MIKQISTCDIEKQRQISVTLHKTPTLYHAVLSACSNSVLHLFQINFCDAFGSAERAAPIYALLPRNNTVTLRNVSMPDCRTDWMRLTDSSLAHVWYEKVISFKLAFYNYIVYFFWLMFQLEKLPVAQVNQQTVLELTRSILHPIFLNGIR